MRREIAQKHLTETVAHMIWFSVECKDPDRATHDWRCAEEMVNGPLRWMVDAMANPFLLPNGFAKWVWCADFMQDWEESYDEFKKRFWRVIWENFRHLRGSLPRPLYGAIVFS